MSMKRTCPISNSISFLISAGIQEVTLHYASFINLLLVQVSRGKAADYRTILRKYVVKLPLSAKRQDCRAIVSAQATGRFSRSADRRGAGPRRAAVLRRHSSA